MVLKRLDEEKEKRTGRLVVETLRKCGAALKYRRVSWAPNVTTATVPRHRFALADARAQPANEQSPAMSARRIGPVNVVVDEHGTGVHSIRYRRAQHIRG